MKTIRFAYHKTIVKQTIFFKAYAKLAFLIGRNNSIFTF